MNKDLVLASIDTIIEGLAVLKKAVQEDGGGMQDVKEMKSEIKAEKQEEVKEAVKEKDNYLDSIPLTEEGLADVKYNDLKKLASHHEVDGKGTRNQIIERLLAIGESEEESNVVDFKSKSQLKREKAQKEEDEEDEVPFEEESTEEEEEVPEFVSKLEAKTQTELADILAEAGLSVKGKKQSLIDRIISAIESGDITIPEEEPTKKTTRKGRGKKTTKKSAFDMSAYISDELKDLAIDLMEQADMSVEDFDVDEEEAVEIISQFAPEAEITIEDAEANTEEVLELVAYIGMLMTDFEGDAMEFREAYQLPDEQWFCCGHPLDENDYCAICDTSWEEDDE